MSDVSGDDKLKSDIVYNKFKIELEKKEIKINSIDDDNLIYIDMDGSELKVSLENVRRNYERDSDDRHIYDLVNIIASYSFELPDWEEAKNKVYIELFPNDFDFENIVNKEVTDEFRKVYVISYNNKISWISKDDLSKWEINETLLIDQANLNLDRLLEKVKIEVEVIDDHKLGMIQIKRTELKSSSLFSSKIVHKIIEEFGSPFYAVIPVRDFCYIFSEEGFSFFSERLGSIVIEEYEKSGYPITTEILKFSENEVSSMGKYK